MRAAQKTMASRATSASGAVVRPARMKRTPWRGATSPAPPGLQCGLRTLYELYSYGRPTVACNGTRRRPSPGACVGPIPATHVRGQGKPRSKPRNAKLSIIKSHGQRGRKAKKGQAKPTKANMSSDGFVPLRVSTATQRGLGRGKPVGPMSINVHQCLPMTTCGEGVGPAQGGDARTGLAYWRARD